MVSLLTLLLVGASPAVAVDKDRSFPTQVQGKECPRTTSVHAFDRNQRVVPRKLGELPPANAYSAVYRLVGGCEVPVIVKYNVGRK